MINTSDLAQFYGTETWTVLRPVFGTWKPQAYPMDNRLLATDGVMYVLKNGGQNGAFWLWDMIASHYMTKGLHTQEFMVITLTVKDNAGVFTIDDGDDNILARQEIEYTDFDLPQIKFYLTTNVLLLPSEY